MISNTIWICKHISSMETCLQFLYESLQERQSDPYTGLRPTVEWRYSPTLSLAWAIDGGGMASPTSRALYPRERPSTHCTEGWVDLRAGMDGCEKSRPPPGFFIKSVYFP
jgi:hypothetical protein